ncbi:MAG TPA: HAMP domain-containing sensor histidine kinase [Bryobacteraceae bacterium]|jgi:signal transduction histidine kinase
MRICVVSDSSELQTLLDYEPALTVLATSPGHTVPEADVYIWDCPPDLELRGQLAAHAEAQHFLLADPKHLEAFGELQSSACVLLKPFAAFRLHAFIELAWKTWQLRKQVQETDSLRSDRDALLQYVLEVNLKLQEYDQERNNFLARALHDFRAPLTALLGYCDLLSEGKIGIVSSAQRALLERMRISAKRLTRLAGGALELLAEGRFEKAPVRTPGDLGEALSQALHDVYPMAKEKDIELKIEIQPAGGLLLFEAEQMQQVLVNLLENACKFTPRGGIIEVHSYPRVDDTRSSRAQASPAEHQENGNRARIPAQPANVYQVDISDSGPGVPEALAEKIFEQYTTYGGGADRSVGGLGLAIARAIIRAHGGKIWATPTAEGGRFSFMLPLQTPSILPAETPLEQFASGSENALSR